jgi:hypothetical protein
MKGFGLHAALRLALLLIALVSARPAFAQAKAAAPVPSERPEELEPRVVGAAGMMSVGFAGFVDRFNSHQTLYSTNFTGRSTSSAS